jgi:glutaryl-CoA dehydrogenase
VIWAKLDGQVHGFLVEKGTPGFQTSEMEGKFSFRASVTSELTFDDCLIPEANLLAQAEGLKAPLMCLNQARYGIAWGAVGAAMACYDAALATRSRASSSASRSRRSSSSRTSWS